MCWKRWCVISAVFGWFLDRFRADIIFIRHWALFPLFSLDLAENDTTIKDPTTETSDQIFQLENENSCGRSHFIASAWRPVTKTARHFFRVRPGNPVQINNFLTFQPRVADELPKHWQSSLCFETLVIRTVAVATADSQGPGFCWSWRPRSAQTGFDVYNVCALQSSWASLTIDHPISRAQTTPRKKKCQTKMWYEI